MVAICLLHQMRISTTNVSSVMIKAKISKIKRFKNNMISSLKRKISCSIVYYFCVIFFCGSFSWTWKYYLKYKIVLKVKLFYNCERNHHIHEELIIYRLYMKTQLSCFVLALKTLMGCIQNDLEDHRSKSLLVFDNEMIEQ